MSSCRGQARNNARVVISGSLELFSNEFFFTEGVANKQFSEALASWVFKHNGVLRMTEPKHHLVGQTSAPREYTVGDELVRHELQFRQSAQLL